MIQRRLQHAGVPMVVLPVRLNLKKGPRARRAEPDGGARALTVSAWGASGCRRLPSAGGPGCADCCSRCRAGHHGRRGRAQGRRARGSTQNGTPDAVAALGRLADTQPRGGLGAGGPLVVRPRRVSRRVGRDACAAPAWGTAMLRDGAHRSAARRSARRAAMAKHDPHLAPFVGDLEGALVRLSATPQNVNVSSTLAERRAAGARTRLSSGALWTRRRVARCARGIASPRTRRRRAQGAARRAGGRPRRAARASTPSVRVAADDETALAWLAEQGEPGLLGAAGKEPSGCRAHACTSHGRERSPRARASAYAALTVPLGYAVDALHRGDRRRPGRRDRPRARGACASSSMPSIRSRATAAPCMPRAPRSPGRRLGPRPARRSRESDRRASSRLRRSGLAAMRLT